MSKEQFAFKKGWGQVTLSAAKACRKDLMDSLGVTTRVAFLNRMKGEVEPKISEVRAIEKVFAKYGIKDVWGM